MNDHMEAMALLRWEPVPDNDDGAENIFVASHRMGSVAPVPHGRAWSWWIVPADGDAHGVVKTKDEAKFALLSAVRKAMRGE